MRRNCEEFGIRLHPMGDVEQGIVHIIGPQLGLTQPGMTVVCGDSHTSTHGAFGALAMGIGTSEVEHVLATQTLPLRPFKTMAVNVDGVLPPGRQRQGHHPGGDREDRHRRRPGLRHRIPRQRHRSAVDGGPDDDLQHEHRGGRAGRHGRARRDHLRVPARAARTRPTGADWDAAVEAWSQLRTDDGAEFDTEVYLDAATLSPFVTWGTNPGQGVPLSAPVPDPELMFDEGERQSAEKALAYMDLQPGTAMRDIAVDTVFVGSCTNGRIEDLRVVADVLRGRKVADGVRMLVVPGSMRVRAQAESEGLGEIFTAAGAEWRQAGCSMCLGMNPDQLAPGERCASTSNRNFEGRQGKGGRTHLVSPAVAAATAVRGTLSSPADSER